MLIHLARVSVITIALALVAGCAFLLARPGQAPTVITVVVPQTAPAAAPVVVAPSPITVVQPAYLHPYWVPACGWQQCWR